MLIEQLESEALKHEQTAVALREAAAALRGTPVGAQPAAKEFKGLGIVDATERLLAEAGEPQSTTQIADALTRRGLETTSKNWIATVYSTLDNSPRVRRLGKNRGGRWALATAADKDNHEAPRA